MGGGARLVDPAVQEVIDWNVDESWAIDWIRCEFAALTFTQIFYRILGDSKNKNSCAIVDKAIQEPEMELKRLNPENNKLEDTTLGKVR